MDSGLTSLGVSARFHGKAAEPQQLAHELGLSGPARAEDLLLAAKRLELKAKLGPFDIERASAGNVPLPCVVELRPSGFAVLGRVEGGKALLHDPAEGRSVVVPVDELKPRLTGRALFLASRATLAAELARFDFTWFIPAIVKYRKLIGEALVASLALQIFALLTPLFFGVLLGPD